MPSKEKKEGSIGDASNKSSKSSNSRFSGMFKKSKQPSEPPAKRLSYPIPMAPDIMTDTNGYYRSIHAVRESSRRLYTALMNEIKEEGEDGFNCFDWDMSQFPQVTEYVANIIKRDFGSNYASIPSHGRWQHFEVNGVPRLQTMMQEWPASVDEKERTRRLIDLFTVSVLLDAGAGSTWKYKSHENGRYYTRSEGLAIASLEMFKAGMFSNDLDQPYQVNALALKKLTVEMIKHALQVTDSNPIDGLEGRADVLIKLGNCVGSRVKSRLFGDKSRPGGVVDFLIQHPTTFNKEGKPLIFTVPTLWNALMDGLGGVWPHGRTSVGGESLGDAWRYAPLRKHYEDQSYIDIVVFHKLTQWLTYSIMTPMIKLMGVVFAGTELLTGLPEYRNGGLLVDTGLISLRKSHVERGLATYGKTVREQAGVQNAEPVPMFEVGDQVIVEWRAITVVVLDELLTSVNEKLGLKGESQLTLGQLLEAGTWKGGRELAAVSRPITQRPPISIFSDGTVF